MNVGVVGSKEYPDLNAVRRLAYSLSRDETLVTGVAPGVDQAAREAARRGSCGVHVIEPYDGQPVTDHHQEKLDACDRVVIFYNGESEGTRDLIERTLEMGLPAEIHVEPT